MQQGHCNRKQGADPGGGEAECAGQRTAWLGGGADARTLREAAAYHRSLVDGSGDGLPTFTHPVSSSASKGHAARCRSSQRCRLWKLDT